MGRILGIDYGRKRTGIAVTDPLQMFASPLKTVNTHEFDNFLGEFLKTDQVEAIVIGYPVRLNNQPGKIVKYIDPFIRRLQKAYPDIRVYKTDERFTSEIAFRTMIDGGVGKKDRRNKAMVDKISAALILQSFLDRKKTEDRRPKTEESDTSHLTHDIRRSNEKKAES